MARRVRALTRDDLQKLIDMTDAERAEFSYAVATSLQGEPWIVTRYRSMDAASMVAYLIETAGNSVVRFVAVDGPEWSKSVPVPGWRQVTTFNDVA